jgi:HEAT repeat protein
VKLLEQQGQFDAATALGPLGAGGSLSVLESLQADDDPSVRAAVAEVLLTAPPAAAIPILQEMAAESRPAAWALIRLGAKAESAIVEILTEPTFRSSAPGHVIREYYEH